MKGEQTLFDLNSSDFEEEVMKLMVNKTFLTPHIYLLLRYYFLFLLTFIIVSLYLKDSQMKWAIFPDQTHFGILP